MRVYWPIVWDLLFFFGRVNGNVHESMKSDEISCLYFSKNSLLVFSLFYLCVKSSVLHKVKAYLIVFIFFSFISSKDCKNSTQTVQQFSFVVEAMARWVEWVVFKPQCWWFNPWQVFLDKTLYHLVTPWMAGVLNKGFSFKIQNLKVLLY